MQFIQAILGVTLAVSLSACAQRTDKRDSDPLHWGNYKCITRGNGQDFQGWSTNRSDAKHNSKAICEQHASSCEFVSCQNETAMAGTEEG
jgi:hypothetical protein